MPSAQPRPSYTARLLDFLGRLARKGERVATPDPARRRLILLQIDGLSSKWLERALSRGYFPHLSRRLAAGQFQWKRLTTVNAPSTPVFQAGLLYGEFGGIPGFGWYDRRLGRVVRMDLAEDCEAVQKDLDHGHDRTPGAPTLLDDGGVSYGTIFTGRATDTFFNVIRWARPDSTPAERTPEPSKNTWDRLASVAMWSVIGTRLWKPLVMELGTGVWDLARFFHRERTTRFEWRFLYMRLFTSVVLREIETFGIILDVFRGVPVLYADYFGYDEYAHRRGPDGNFALFNLRAIDEDLERILRAVERAPEYNYDVYILSDHGQSESRPFERVMGEDLTSFVLSHAVASEDKKPQRKAGLGVSEAVRHLVQIRTMRFWVHTLWPPVRAAFEPYLAWLERHAEAALRIASGKPLDRFRVVTGGTIAHVYLDHGREPAMLETLDEKWPFLVESLALCEGIGLMAARSRRGPVVFYRGKRYPLSDRKKLASLEPFRRAGFEVLSQQLAAAVGSERSGDLVLYGAFAPAGNIAFDFELGSHGGVHPDELDHFLLHPSSVEVPLEGPVRADELHRFFVSRYRMPARPEQPASPVSPATDQPATPISLPMAQSQKDKIVNGASATTSATSSATTSATTSERPARQAFGRARRMAQATAKATRKPATRSKRGGG